MTAQDPRAHPALLQEISHEFPNTIRLLDSPCPIEGYSCFMHALGFTHNSEYTEIARVGSRDIYASAAFAHWLITEQHLVKVLRKKARAGDFVFNLNRREFKHVGLFSPPDRVTSKWGTGHLYEHGIFEVPESYGNHVQFYNGLSRKDAFECFIRFAKERNFPVERVIGRPSH